MLLRRSVLTETSTESMEGQVAIEHLSKAGDLIALLDDVPNRSPGDGSRPLALPSRRHRGDNVVTVGVGYHVAASSG
ncbi:hypothetical protein CG716_00660 [Mycolicibacterium sphagni]|uniref:Uncharacterized protein n=1 Tax=Mycolicibacterium sphagni TaxID=1786 RepID=A0A255DUM7_9MYCO|nr:hypothetical protein CG716_00660 [Mycolicibacterium sphagni]